MADTATAKYLENNIGGVLAKALAEMSVAQPKDGVDFLSQWLKTYAEQEEAKASRDAEEKMLDEERAKTQRRLEERDGRRQKRISDQDAKDNAYKELFEQFKDPNTKFEEQMWDQLVDVAKKVSGAQAVYLGHQDLEGLDDGAEGTGPCIRYDRASAGSEFMKELVLPKDLSAKYGTPGITWGVWDDKPPDEALAEKFLWKPPMPEPPPVDPAADPPADPPVVESPWPNYPVYVECVTDVEAVHYFDMTRLGAYLAVPLVYPSYYTDSALKEAQVFETQVKEEKAEKERLDAEEAEKKRLEEESNPKPEGDEDEGEKAPSPEPPPEPEEEKDPNLPGDPVKMVLCLDTLGSNTAFEETKMKDLLELCRVAGECKARMEKNQIRAQARVIVDLDPEAPDPDPVAEEDSSALKEQKETEEKQVEEHIAAQDPPMEDPEKGLRKDLLERKYEYLGQLAKLEARKAALFDFKDWVVVQKEVLDVLAGIALMFDYPSDQMYPRRKKVFKWETLKHILADELFGRIRATDMEKPRKKLRPEQKMSKLIELLPNPEFTEEEAKKVSPVFKDLLNFTQSARAYRQADLEWRKAEFNKEKEEKGDAWEGKDVDGTIVKDLADLDDDFKE